jgi:two-component system, NtrC family, sensor histidine kinase HydH
MAARKEQNLLEQALRTAQASGRSHQARLNCLLRLAVRTLGLSSATVFLPDPNLDALTGRVTTSLPFSSRSCLIPYGEGCSGRAALGRSRENSDSLGLHPDEPIDGEDACFLALPLLDGKQLAAVLYLAGTKQISKAQLAGSVQLAPIITLLVAGLAAQQVAEQERRDLALIASLGKLLNKPQTPEALLPRLLKLCTGRGLSRCAFIRLSEGESEKARLFRHCSSGDRAALPELLQAEPLLSARAVAETATRRETLTLPETCRHALCIPLSCNCRTLGTMTLFGGPELLSRGQTELAETVARLLSSALGEAISSQRILSFARENDKKLKELSLLYRMSNTMLSTIKLNKLIHLTLSALTSGPTPFFDRAMLFLSNDRSGVLLGMLGMTRESSTPLSFHQGGDDVLSTRWDISEEDMAAQRDSEFCRQVMGMRIKLTGAQSAAARAVLEKKLIHMPAKSEIGCDDPHHGRGHALAATPLIAHGKPVGAVMVDNALTKAPISREDLRFLQLFTNQAGMAIENSMLFHKLEDANRQLGEAQENLLQKERLAAIGEMAAGIAHELKGPLVSIGGFAGRLTKKLPEATPERENADLIVREVLRLEGVLSEILLFSKKSTICYARCSIAAIVKECLAVVGPPIEEKQISVSVKLPRRELAFLGDEQQLKQVFINILLNAAEAMGPGGKLSLQVSTTDLDGKEAVCVTIIDTGGGIPLESLNSIFTPFYTTKESGTGLGLPIANRIVTNHGGKIQFTNTPGQGVEFRVILPKHW